MAEVLEAPHLVTDVDHETIAVASAELAAESLGLHDPNISLNDIQQTLLQEVAQVRAFHVHLARVFDAFLLRVRLRAGVYVCMCAYRWCPPSTTTGW